MMHMLPFNDHLTIRGFPRRRCSRVIIPLEMVYASHLHVHVTCVCLTCVHIHVGVENPKMSIRRKIRAIRMLQVMPSSPGHM